MADFPHSLHEMHLWGFVVAVFIKSNIQSKMMINTTTMIVHKGSGYKVRYVVSFLWSWTTQVISILICYIFLRELVLTQGYLS